MEISQVRNVTERANSFCGRYGGPGTDFKIYWDTLTELKQGIANVIEGKGFLETFNEPASKPEGSK